jgi:ATP-dependent protease ClpP protease subunit
MSSAPGFSLLSKDCWSLFGDLEPYAAVPLIKAIHKSRPKADPLILLCSGGGDVHLTLALVAMIRKKLRAEIRVTGYAHSAAVHFLQAGCLRTAHRGTGFFTHPFSDSCATTNANFKSYGESTGRLLNKWTRLLAERTGRRARFWRDFLDKERFFDEEEALRLGLIDAIV